MGGRPVPDDDSSRDASGRGLAEQSTLDASVRSIAAAKDARQSSDVVSNRDRPNPAEVEQPPRFADGALVANRFRVVRFIARGGMGEVFEAEDLELKERIALKTLDLSRGSAEAALARFKREAALTRRITHPNVCRMFDVGFHIDDATHSTVPFLTMQLLRGETLEARIRREKGMAPEALLAVAADLCAGLSAAHSAGIIHRDLKSTNVVFDRGDDGQERAVITDFGLARLHEDTGGVTHEGQILGTPKTMAPEQVNGAPVTPLTDLYSLGIVLFEALTGRFPFESGSPVTTATMRLTQKAPSVRERRPDVPRVWERVVARCLERDPRRRFQSADDLLRALRAPAPRAGRGGVAAVSLALVGGAIGVVAVTSGAARHARMLLSPSPLAPPSSVLACPLLRAAPVDGASGDPGWLGAAAADLACRRARWILGGAAERVRGPAELLHLPRQPGTDIAADPFVGDARERSVVAAKSEGAAWLDGSVAHSAAGFKVTLDGRGRAAGDERPFAHAEAEDPRLDVAVARALDALVGPAALPRAAALDPEVARWTGGASIDQMIRVDALHWRIEQGEVDDATGCALVAADASPVAARYPFITAACVSPKGTDLPALADDGALETQALAVLSRTVALPADWHPLVDRLDAARMKARGRQERVTLALSEADVLQRESETSRARLVLLDALLYAPEEIAVWNVLGTSAAYEGRGTPAWAQFQHLLTTWMPEMPAYQATGGSVYEKDLEVRVANAARAHLLAPANQNDAVQLGRALLDAGRTEEVRALAAGLISGSRDGKLTGHLLLSSIELREGRFGRALERLRTALAAAGPYTQTTWAMSYAVNTLITTSDLLGQEQGVADEWVAHVVLAEPPHLVTPVQLRGELAILAMCTRATAGVQAACYDRVDHLRAGGDIPEWSEDSGRLLKGAREAHEGRFRAAVETWRPLLASASYRALLPYDVFVRADALDLAAALDEDSLKRKTFGGEGAYVCREADRLNRLGDVAHARELAQRAVTAWGEVDVEVPCLNAARAILRDGAARSTPK